MKNIKKVLIIYIIMLIFITVISNLSYAKISDPNDYSTSIPTSPQAISIGNKIIGTVQLFGSILSVIVLIVIGIKYMMGSVEERADYKKTLIPYLIGAVLVFGIVNILSIINSIMNGGFNVNQLSGTTINNQTAKDIGNTIITVLSTIGSIISVITLVIIGIKYMLGSTEEKSVYKKSLMPYVIGAVLVFGASIIAGMVYSLIP